jgi:hypothetical protein
MNGITDIHPDAVLAALLDKGGRSNRRANLTKMHELCRRQQAAGSRDFSLPAIGRLAEAEGILKGRALYNAPSADTVRSSKRGQLMRDPPRPRHRRPWRAMTT